MKIHQILPNFSYGDAIGDDTLALRNILQDLGYQSRIYAGVIHPYLTQEASHFKTYRLESQASNLLLYHFSVGSELTEFIEVLPDRLGVIFHNITPPEWFFGISPHMVELAVTGWRQLERLKNRADFAWADSEYNASILDRLGYRIVRVLPIIVDLNRLNLPRSRLFDAMYRSNLETWMFAGRVTPNKCHQDIIRVFAHYQKNINPHSRLFLVGDVRNCSRYAEAMQSLIRELGVSNVIMTGMIDDQELIALYRMADLFVCMSEHEGFCVPLLEAMYFNIPVVAFDAGAVAGTLGSAGVLVRRKDPVFLAELIHQILTDNRMKQEILKKQRQRIEEIQAIDYGSIVDNLLLEILS